MDKESLEKARNIITDHIMASDIRLADKIELIINLYHFLKETEYQKNIAVLQRQKRKIK